MASDPQRIQSVFLKIAELPAAERPAALARECGGDLELRTRIEALLKAHDEPGGSLDLLLPQLAATELSDLDRDDVSSPAETVDRPLDAREGTKISGRYTLLEKIGEGGMGEVWIAKQSEPVKRKVAVKLIRLGMDSKAVLARFEQERQALALMDHPNIARVLDGGVTTTGQPYFVMELVNGLPLSKFCDEAKLTLNHRLELFVPICQAVQHAHQKGIVHRDLKPANILITLIDGRPVPKVIDFGVAKATGGKLIDESLSTQFGAVVGTLEYMSPEQAGFSGVDVDTRADIYSLGVILYEMLTGLRPIDSQRLKKAAVVEMIRIIREEEPSRPSTRLSSDASLPSLAALRQTEPRKLTAILRGELDWVVMKCLEKSRDRRYETANALGRDIQRYLANEPVEARPPSIGYRLGKFLARNKGPAIAASLVLLALVGGIIGTTFGLVAANQSRLLAEKKEAEAIRSAQAEANAKQQSDQQRLRAEELLSRAQCAQGVALLEQGNPLGLLNLVEARRTVEDVPHLRAARTALWSGWYTGCADRLQHVFAGSGMRQIAFSPDGRTLAARGMINELRFWDPVTGQAGQSISNVGDRTDYKMHPLVYTADGRQLFVFLGMQAELWDVVTRKRAAGPLDLGPGDKPRAWISRDAKWIAKKTDTQAVQVVELSTNKPVGKKLFPGDKVKFVAISPTGESLVTVGDRVQLWNIATGEAQGPASPFTGVRPTHLPYSGDGKRYAVVSQKIFICSVQLFDAATGMQQETTITHAGSQMPGSVVEKIMFSPDDSLLATMSTENIQLWDVATGKLHGQPLHAESGLYDCAFSPNGQWLATASGEGKAQLWTVSTGEPYGPALWHREPVREVVFSPDSRQLATVSGGVARVWRAEVGEPHEPPLLQRDQILDAAFSPDGKILASVEPSAIRLWDTATGKALREPLEQDGLQGRVTFSGDGRYLAAAVVHGVQLWETSTWNRRDKPLDCAEEIIVGLTFSHDDQWVAALIQDGIFRIWNTTTGKPYAPPIQQERIQSGFFDPMFTPDGKLLAARGSFGMVVLDMVAGKRIEPLIRPGDISEKPQMRWTMSADGRWKVVFEGKGLRLRDVRANTDGALITPPSQFFQIVFNRECDAVASAFEDGSVRVWDAATGKPQGPIIALRNGMPQIAFRPGGKQLATLSSKGATQLTFPSNGGTIRLWEIATGLPIGRAWHHPGMLPRIAFSPTGNRLMAVSIAEKLRLWSLPDDCLSLREMELRTWLALGMRPDAQGAYETIAGEQWQDMKEKLGHTTQPLAPSR